jgi:hypothetical protein
MNKLKLDGADPSNLFPRELLSDMLPCNSLKYSINPTGKQRNSVIDLRQWAHSIFPKTKISGGKIPVFTY